ncbi:MAG: hypothetical protein KC636_37595 [Myxococcales bacterium]|nr:hypothetical protein [Myxococcales bacterium]
MAYGDESAFTEEAGRRVARVALRRGWSTRFLVMGGKRNERASPLAGADVVLDGEVVGRTGPDGGLVVALDAQPAAVEVRYFGWSLGRAISLEKSRSNVTPVILVEPD